LRERGLYVSPVDSASKTSSTLRSHARTPHRTARAAGDTARTDAASHGQRTTRRTRHTPHAHKRRREPHKPRRQRVRGRATQERVGGFEAACTH
jgi:hypothetical protein